MNKLLLWGLIFSLTVLTSCGGGKNSDRENTNVATESTLGGENNEETESEPNSGSNSGSNTSTQICDPQSTETQSCVNEISNALTATITQTCSNDGSSFTQSACQLVACNEGFEINGNSCVAIASPQVCEPNAVETLSCANQISNALTATMTRTCSADGLSTTESECQVQTCQNGFEMNGNSCVAIASPQVCEPNAVETLSCANQISNALTATMTQTCSVDGLSTTDSECQVQTCQNGFEVNGNTCVASQSSAGGFQERFLTYIGGSEFERIQGAFIDDSGYIYIVGTTMSPNFPTTIGAYQETKPSPAGSTLEQSDTFIAKLLPDAQGIEWATYLGASRRESAYGVRVDSNGNVYVSGTTGSPDFPTTDGTTNKGPFSTNNLADIFVAKFNSSGTLLFSTLVGGAQGKEENPRGSILVDEINNRIYVSGMTSAPDFPTTPNTVQPNFGGGGFDGFIFAMEDDGSRIIASTFLGGRGADMAFTSLAQHSDGSIIIGGATNSDDFPVTAGAYQTSFAGATPNQQHWEQGGDGFAVRLSPNLDQRIYSTYIGGSGTDTVCHNQGVSINSQNQGVFYVNVQSQDFPTTTGNQNRSGSSDTAVVVLAEDGSSIVSSTLIGGNADDYASGIKVGSDDRIYISGSTSSTNFPLSSDPFQQSIGGGNDAFLTVLEPDLSQISYSTYFGGSNDDSGRGLWVNSSNNVIIGGVSGSSNMPVVNPGISQSYNGGSQDAILFGLEEQP